MIDTTRHQAFVAGVNLRTELHVIGCGSIGTVVATTLCRMGFSNFILYDEDEVEAHNIANQYFEAADIGQKKVDVLEQKLKALDAWVHVSKRGFYTESDGVPSGTVVIVCVDSMASRKAVADSLEGDVLLIDGRMGGESGLVHAVRRMEIDGWEMYCRSLYSDAEASELPCTARTIIYTVAITANIMAKMVLLFLRERARTYQAYAVDMATVNLLELVSLRAESRA